MCAKTIFNSLVFIDDDHATNIFHRLVVEESGLCQNHHFFTSPVEALDHFTSLSENSEAQLPEVIFLDINMPRMTGWEFLERFQDLPFATFPTIIMLTSSMFPDDIQQSQSNQLVYKLINKPLQVSHLEELRNALLKTSL